MTGAVFFFILKFFVDGAGKSKPYTVRGRLYTAFLFADCLLSRLIIIFRNPNGAHTGSPRTSARQISDRNTINRDCAYGTEKIMNKRREEQGLTVDYCNVFKGQKECEQIVNCQIFSKKLLTFLRYRSIIYTES